MTITPTKLLYLPGAGGSADFWRPVASLQTHPASRVLLGWPGFGSVPANSAVQNIDDLVALVVNQIDQPTALVAQSMGGVVAILAALKRPALISHLVLAATSGGVNMSDLRVADWRQAFIEANPTLPRWFADFNVDLSPSIGAIQAPTLLLWGESDLISPIDVGLRLKGLLPSSRIHVLPNGEHDFANKLATKVASLIDTHINDA